MTDTGRGCGHVTETIDAVYGLARHLVSNGVERSAAWRLLLAVAEYDSSLLALARQRCASVLASSPEDTTAQRALFLLDRTLAPIEAIDPSRGAYRRA